MTLSTRANFDEIVTAFLMSHVTDTAYKKKRGGGERERERENLTLRRRLPVLHQGTCHSRTTRSRNSLWAALCKPVLPLLQTKLLRWVKHVQSGKSSILDSRGKVEKKILKVQRRVGWLHVYRPWSYLKDARISLEQNSQRPEHFIGEYIQYTV